MSIFIKKVAAPLLGINSSFVQVLRYRGKINIQRPRKPHYERARVLAATQPIYPEGNKIQDCFVPTKENHLETVNQYDNIIAREVRNWLEHSPMVAIFHLNSINADDMFKVRVKLHRQSMHLKSYGKKIMSKAVVGTRYEAISVLFDSNQCIVFSMKQNANILLRITKKVPQMLLLAGIVDNRLLSRNEFIEYARLPNLQMTQSELIQILNMSSENLITQLKAHQNNVVNILDVYSNKTNSIE